VSAQKKAVEYRSFTLRRQGVHFFTTQHDQAIIVQRKRPIEKNIC
jgi:hypothetical protein